MSERRTVLFAAATAASSGKFYLSGEELPAKVEISGLTSGDTVDLMEGDGVTFEDSYDGAQVQFSYQTKNTVAIYAPGHYKVDKGSTTGTVAAILHTS